MTNVDPLQLAVQHHEAGRLDEAENLYRRIISTDPNDADALHFLGLLLGQRGNNLEALDFISRALAIEPDVVEFLCNYGEFSRRAGKLAQAVDAFTKAINLDPSCALAHYNLGVTLSESNQPDSALAAYAEAVRLSPTSQEMLITLGLAVRKARRLEEAIPVFQKVLEIDPKSSAAWLALAASCRETERFDQAIAAYRRAIELKPDSAEAHNNLANLYKHTMQLDAAVDHYNRALALKPEFAPTLINLAIVLRDLGRLDEAISTCENAISFLEKSPARGPAARLLSDACTNLGNCLKDQCQITDALAAYANAVELNPANVIADSSRLYTLHLDPDCDAQILLAEHKRWATRHAEALVAPIEPYTHDRSPDRRLRIGYVSPDFRDHAVARMLMPLLANHDHKSFCIVCYSDTPHADAITRRARGYSDEWNDSARLTDEELAQKIRHDRIDILIDLAAHTAGNRLLAFARKPAPVQITWLGCPTTTGLPAIEYRLTDPHLDPPGRTDHDYTEKSIRVPQTIWCFEPQPQIPDVSPLPALTAGHITFGSLNNFAKLNPVTLGLWSEVLQAIPNSRILIKAPAGSAQIRVRDFFQSQSILPDRVEFIPKVPAQQYYAQYHRIDIGLDPTPYNGHTTTFDYLWMGVPVITLPGRTCVSRGGQSILSNLALHEFIAKSPEEYVQAAIRQANDIPKLSGLRATLRQRMQESPLMDAKTYAAHIETAYRQIWQTHPY